VPEDRGRARPVVDDVPGMARTRAGSACGHPTDHEGLGALGQGELPIGVAFAYGDRGAGIGWSRVAGFGRRPGAEVSTRTAEMLSIRTTECSAPSAARITPWPSTPTTWPVSHVPSTRTATGTPPSWARLNAVPIVYSVESPMRTPWSRPLSGLVEGQACVPRLSRSCIRSRVASRFARPVNADHPISSSDTTRTGHDMVRRLCFRTVVSPQARSQPHLVGRPPCALRHTFVSRGSGMAR
jgi:hypothetical protein